MDEALIQDPQHEIDRDQRPPDQQRLRRRVGRKRFGISRRFRVDRCWQRELQNCLIDGLRRLIELGAGGQIIGDGHCRKRARMIDDERRQPALHFDHFHQRNLRASCRWHINPRQIADIALELRVDLQHDLILVAGPVDRRDLALCKRIVQRVVDIADLDPQPRRRDPVDGHASLESALQPVS